MQDQTSRLLTKFWIKHTTALRLINAWSTKTWCFKFSLRCSQTQTLMSMQTVKSNAEWSSSVLQCSQVFSWSQSCSPAGHRSRRKAAKLSLKWWEEDMGMRQIPCPPQRTACHHGEPYRLLLQWHGQWQSTHFSKVSRALSWRQWSMLFGPKHRSMEQILMLPCPIWAKKWSLRRAWLCNLFVLQRLGVSHWGLKLKLSWGK